MPDEIRTVPRDLRHEIPKVKGSRFVADVAPVADAEAAGAFLGRVRAAFPDASHHCYAWRVDERTFRSGDDGEPSGTAGRPILQQIDARDLVRTAVVVTRWFGGTKLGAGGLVRAYGGAAAEALDRAGVRVLVVTRTVVVEHPYDVSGEVQAVLTARGLDPVAGDYEETVRLVLEVPADRAEEVARELVERTAARARVTVGERES